MRYLRFFLILCLILPFINLHADEIDKRNKITKNLRCLICQGQSIYDSDSEFANSLKIVVDKKIAGGNIKEACEKIGFIDAKIKDAYLEKFKIYCLIFNNKRL